MASKTDSGSSSAPRAGWTWEHLSPAQQRDVWGRFVGWVERLRLTYMTVVRLPPCWARHDELVNELRLFWYWDMTLQAGGRPDEAIRWHNELRHSAEAWRKLANCDHEDPSPIHLEIAEKRATEVHHHVDLAMRERGLQPLGNPADEASTRFS